MAIADDKVIGSFFRYMTRQQMNTDSPGSVPYQELEKEFGALEQGMKEFRAEAERVLEEMDKPI